MATQKATNITEFDTTPPSVVDSKTANGYERVIFDTIEATALSVSDVVILARVPVDALLSSVLLATDDLGTTGVLDLGYYKKNADGTYTAVDSNNLASSLDVNTAAVAFTERRYSAHNIDTVQKKVWELAGLSARPSYDHMYIALTATTATTATGTISIIVKYTC